MKIARYLALRLGLRMRRSIEVSSVYEVPVRLRWTETVLVGPTDSPAWLAFDCPCRHAHRVLLSLDADNRPAWHLDAGDLVNLSPSVDQVSEVGRCHYFVHQGRIRWVR